MGLPTFLQQVLKFKTVMRMVWWWFHPTIKSWMGPVDVSQTKPHSNNNDRRNKSYSSSTKQLTGTTESSTNPKTPSPRKDMRGTTPINEIGDLPALSLNKNYEREHQKQEAVLYRNGNNKVCFCMHKISMNDFIPKPYILDIFFLRKGSFYRIPQLVSSERFIRQVVQVGIFAGFHFFGVIRRMGSHDEEND
jgi:hypothetical protein